MTLGTEYGVKSNSVQLGVFRLTLIFPDIIEVFRLFDVDGSGTISTHELDAAIRCLGKIPSEADKSVGESGGCIFSMLIT